LPPSDDNGNVGWTFEGEPTTNREKRWLVLYRKHERALAHGSSKSDLGGLAAEAAEGLGGIRGIIKPSPSLGKFGN
jgi:hypothetical protein